MKILIVTQYFYPENFKINDLALELVARGHQIVVSTSIPNYPEGKFFNNFGLFKKTKEDYKGLKIYRNWIIPRGNGSTMRIILNYVSGFFFSTLSVIFRIRQRFDVQFVFAPSPLTAAIPAIVNKLFRKTPVVLWLQDVWPESVFAMTNYKSKIFKYLINKISILVYKKSDIILNQSQGYEDLLNFKGISSEKMAYIPNWADKVETKSSNEISLTVNKLMPKGCNIIFAGNIGEAQDFPAILSAAEIIARQKIKINIVIIGSGALSEWLTNEIKVRQLEGIVFQLGRFPLEYMPAFFEKSTALLVSLKKNPAFELTIPGKVQMYLETGKPILAMLDGEGAKLVNNTQAGLCCESGDFEQLAKNMIKIKKSSVMELKRMAKKGLIFSAKNFERKKIITNIEEILNSVIIKSRKYP